MKLLQRHMCSRQPHATTPLGSTFTSGKRGPTSLGAFPNQHRALHQRACCTLSAVGFLPAPVRVQQSCRFSRLGSRPPALPTNRVLFSSKAKMDKGPKIHDIFEPVTGTWQYVVADPVTLKAVIIDPVLDYDPASQIITTEAADTLLALVSENGYCIERILETHAHADHLTAASYLQNRLGQTQGHEPLIGIGERIVQVQELFGQRYGIPANEYDAVFDTLLRDDETFDIGDLKGTAIHLPGHTPDHLGYMIGGKSP